MTRGRRALLIAVHVLLWFLTPSFYLYGFGLWHEAHPYYLPSNAGLYELIALLVGMLLWGVAIYWIHFHGGRILIRILGYCLVMIPLYVGALLVAAFVQVFSFGM